MVLTVDQSLVHIGLAVRDDYEAIEFYTRKPGFDLIEDTPRRVSAIAAYDLRRRLASDR